MAPAGRLDTDSSGLMIWTENGALSKLVTSSRVEKEYLVDVVPTLVAKPGKKGPVDLDEVCRRFGSFTLDGERLRPVKAERIDAEHYEGTALSGSISTILTVLSWICVGIHRCGVLSSPVCA